MSSKTPILFVGATGYIGGSVLARLLARPDASSFHITALVRSPEKAEKLKAFGVTPVLGSLQDLSILEDLASKAHVVFSCADCDDLPSATAILKGLRKRHETVGDLPILIHTSGTGVLTYGDANTGGMSVSEKIYDDADADDIEKTLPETALHRNVDLPIVRADQEGYLRAYIILPSTIWGVAKNALVDAGIVNPHSKCVPLILNAIMSRGRAATVGKGLAVWPSVEIEEQVDLYIIIFDAATKNPQTIGHGRDGYYFGISDDGEFSWYDITKQIGKALVELGVHKESEPESFQKGELAKCFGSEEFGSYFGTNSRGVANHSKSLGWNPKKGVKDFFASVKPEVEILLSQRKE